MASGDRDEVRDPKMKLFIRLPRERFTPDQEDFVKDKLFDLLGDTPVKDFEPHINKGYCFLHFKDRMTAAIGHDKIFNQPVNGFTIRPFFGFTRTEQRAVDAGIKDEEIERNHRTVYVKDVPATTQKEEIEEIFGQHGDVVKVNIVKAKSTTAVFVLYQKFTPAMQCLEAFANGVEINGTMCPVELSKNKNLQRRIEKFASQAGYGGHDNYHMPPRGGHGGGYGGPGMGRGGWGGQNRAGNGQWGNYWAHWGAWAQSQGGGHGGGSQQPWAPNAPWRRGGRGRGGGRGGNRYNSGGGRPNYGRRHNPY